jgi:hypothetical protein
LDQPGRFDGITWNIDGRNVQCLWVHRELDTKENSTAVLKAATKEKGEDSM